jgi:hypothetical protein
MRGLSLILILLSLTCCSVFMAAKGGKEYNYALLKEGNSRDAILASFGEPESSETKEDGRIIDTYKLEEGDKSKPGLAAGHLVMDVYTLGLWEIAGTVIEANEGRDVIYEITYGPDGKVHSVFPPLFGAVPKPRNFGKNAHSPASPPIPFLQ